MKDDGIVKQRTIEMMNDDRRGDSERTVQKRYAADEANKTMRATVNRRRKEERTEPL